MSLELEEQYEKIYTFCYFRVRNRDLAEDITQETFLKYFETTQYLEKGKKLSFLYTIARNCCNDYFRKAKRTVDMEQVPELPDEIADSLETVITVQNAVSKLNREEQELVLLKFGNELGIGEIAEYLGISRFAVYRKLRGIEKQLKSVLKEEDFYG